MGRKPSNCSALQRVHCLEGMCQSERNKVGIHSKASQSF
uniref:Root phototropism protein 3 isoform X2 n=1 Tax=Rhizophora mucronata TaxID=61149 RepID=A0A2P2N245_RHIMU